MRSLSNGEFRNVSNRSTHAVRLLSALSVLSLGAMGCDQPAPKCGVARGMFAATYTLVSGEGECAMLHGDLLGVQAYNARTSASDDRPDYDKTSVAIQPQALTDLLGASAGLADPNEDDLPYALGRFAHSSPKSSYCDVPELSVARLRLPEIAEQEVDACTTLPVQPAVDISYEWSNVRVLVTPANYGTRFEADLTYTNGDCTATYKVAAIYPVVSCDAAPVPEEPEATDPEETDEEPMCPAEPEPVTPIPDDGLCAAVPDVAAGHPIGSGISPDFAVRCDPDLLLCVLKD